MEKAVKEFVEGTVIPRSYDSLGRPPQNNNFTVKCEPLTKKTKSSDLKKEFAQLALYIILGFDVTVDVRIPIQLIESKTISEKRTGCLFVSLLLNSKPGLAPFFYQEITSLFVDQKNDLFICLALSTISCSLTKDIAKELGHLVADVAVSSNVSNTTRQKALMTLATIYTKTGVFSSVDEVIPKLIPIMQSVNMSLSSCACGVIISLLEYGGFDLPEEVFKNAIKVVTAVILERAVKKVYKIDDVPAPFSMMKFFKILGYKKQWDETNEIPHMNAVMAKLITSRKQKRKEMASDAFFMVFSEAAISLAKAPLAKKVGDKLISILLGYVQESNPMMVGFSLKALKNAAKSTQQYNKKIYAARGVLQRAIYRKQKPFDQMALEVLFLASPGNEPIAETALLTMISYIPPYLMFAAQSYCIDIVLRNNDHHAVFPKLISMMIKGTPEFCDKSWPKVANYVMKQDSFTKIDTEYILQSLSSSPKCNQGFVKLAAYLAGQYGHLCDCGGNGVIEILVENFDTFSSGAQAAIISAMTKISTRLPELRTPAIEYLSDHLSSPNLEVVQRCREGGALLSSNELLLKKTLQNPKFTGITYFDTKNPDLSSSVLPFPQASQTRVVISTPPPNHVRKPSEGFWQPQLISPVRRQGSLHKFDIPEPSKPASNEMLSGLDSIPEESEEMNPPITVIDSPEEDSEDITQSPMYSTTFTVSNPEFFANSEETRRILDQFRESNRGIIYEGDDYSILAMVDVNPPIASLTYKIASFSQIPMSIDTFDVKDTPGLQFALGERPNIVNGNGYILIRDHVRTTNVFTKSPYLSVSVGGWSANVPIPIMPFMWTTPINVDQEGFVARWQALADNPICKLECFCKDKSENSIAIAMKRCLGLLKCEWAPQGRPAFSGGFKIASGNTGFLVIFSTEGTSLFVEVRSTNGETVTGLASIIQTELSFM